MNRRPSTTRDAVHEVINRSYLPSQVIEFYSCGSAIEHMVARSPEELGLHPRDVSLFAADSRLFPQRATITARNGVIYFKTEAVKAIVHREKAIVFKSK